MGPASSKGTTGLDSVARALLKALYAEGIVSSHLWRSGVACHSHHMVAYSSPSTLSARSVNPVNVDAYLLSPQGSAMYVITNSPAPHVTKLPSRK